MSIKNNIRASYQANSGLYVDPQAMLGNQCVDAGTDAALTLVNGDSNKVFVATKASATQTYTLPKASTVPGMQITLICGDAAGEINTAVDAADSIKGMTFAAVGTDADTAALSTTAGHGIKNTAATNVIGDNVTLMSDGIATWWIIGIAVGIWAAL
jgi:hypothetical protein